MPWPLRGSSRRVAMAISSVNISTALCTTGSGRQRSMEILYHHRLIASPARIRSSSRLRRNGSPSSSSLLFGTAMLLASPTATSNPRTFSSPPGAGSTLRTSHPLSNQYTCQKTIPRISLTSSTPPGAEHVILLQKDFWERTRSARNTRMLRKRWTYSVSDV